MQQFLDEPGSADPAVPVVFARTDGDVEVAWVKDGETRQLRRFRTHLGHVVEVLGPDAKLRRVGAGLKYSGSLRVDAPLRIVLEHALEQAPLAAGAHELSISACTATASTAEPGSQACAQQSGHQGGRSLIYQLARLRETGLAALSRIRLAGRGRSRAVEEIELLLHHPTRHGDVNIARCAKGSYCVVWRSQVIGCFPELQMALDKAALGQTARPADCTDLAALRLSAAITDWLPCPAHSRIEALRLH